MLFKKKKRCLCHFLLGWISCVNSSNDKAEVLQGDELHSVNFVSVCVKSTSRSHFVKNYCPWNFTARVCVAVIPFGNCYSLEYFLETVLFW